MKTKHWVVEIPADKREGGIYKFRSCKAACNFANDYARLNQLAGLPATIYPAKRVSA